ncbi:MAG: PAS domain S-box protein [Gammaproteobacteria bacterium]|nr:PAS domain S-box protein [Gammaproteobacteria bacterium]
MTSISTDQALQRYFAMSRDMACIAGFDGYMKSVSTALLDLLGYSFKEIAAKPIIEFLHPEDRAATAQEMARLAAGGVSIAFETRFYAKAGSLHRLSWNASADLERQMIFGFARDVTAEGAALHALHNTLEIQRAILNGANYSIISTDTQGVILTFNAAAERMLGYSAAEVVGKLTPEVIHDGAEVVQRAAQLSRELGMTMEPGFDVFVEQSRRGVAEEREWTYIRKDGSRFPVLLSVTALRDTHGTVNGYLGIAADITERRRLDRMKSEFVSTVSHELRTPMNAILGFTQLLSYDDNLTGVQKSNLRKVHQAGENLLSLVNDVLDLSSLEAGKVALSLEPVAVGKALRECRNLAQAPADAREIQLHMDYDSASDFHVRVDRVRLRQVLLNLITNAVKYNRAGGAVWVTYAAAAAGRVRISVRDNGPGLSAEQQLKLFQPFNRLGAERGEIEGTGIGLTIVRQLVELMQGEIGFVSTPGAGSTFWVEFAGDNGTCDKTPQLECAVLPPFLNAATNRPAAAARVLYIEDNPVNFELVRTLCARFWPQMELQGADTAEAGLELAAAAHPALILMDINLPGMDGYQALARLQADTQLHAIPVIAVTANAMPENILHGRDAGFSDYLTKPLDIPKFVAAVEFQLGKELNLPAPAGEPSVPADYNAVLDAHATAQLRDLLGAKAAPIVDSLLDDLPKSLALLHAAIADGDTPAVRHEAHTMKGSSGNLGATAFAALCTQLSEICKSGELPRLPAAYAVLEQEFKLRVAPALLQFKQELLRSVATP